MRQNSKSEANLKFPEHSRLRPKTEAPCHGLTVLSQGQWQHVRARVVNVSKPTLSMPIFPYKTLYLYTQHLCILSHFERQFIIHTYPMKKSFYVQLKFLGHKPPNFFPKKLPASNNTSDHMSHASF